MKEESFIDYVKRERDLFVVAIRMHEWDTNLRTAAESLLIAYDQMTEKLEKMEK